MKQWFFVILLIFSLIGFSAYFVVKNLLPPPQQAETGRLSFKQIKHASTLSRTSMGFPVAAVKNLEDALFTAGFAHARDHLWRLQVIKWTVDGRLSAVFGDEFSEADKMAVMLTTESIDEKKTNMPLTEAYVNGINSYIDTVQRRYPIPFTITKTSPEKWSTDDVIRYTTLFQWLMDTQWQQSLSFGISNAYIPAALLPYLNEEDQPFILEEDKHETALWLLEHDLLLRKILNAPVGLPALRFAAITPHDAKPDIIISHQNGVYGSSIWIPMRINMDDTIVDGITTPGLPIFFSGMNDKQIWFMNNKELPASSMITNYEEEPDEKYHILQHIDGRETLFTFYANDSLAGSPEFDGQRFSKHQPVSSALLESLIQFPFEELTDEDQHLTRSIFTVLRIQNGQLTQNGQVLQKGLFHGYDSTVSGRIIEVMQAASDTAPSGNPLIEHLNYDGESLHYAGLLADLFSEYQDDESIMLAADYLKNWNGYYDTGSVAASLLKGTEHYITHSTLQSYLPENIYDRLAKYGQLNDMYARGLILQHAIERDAPGTFSPINDAFIIRRLLETFQLYETRLGNLKADWRWGNVFEFRLTNWLLCGSETREHYPGEQVCTFTLSQDPVATTGAPNTLFSGSRNLELTEPLQSITSAYLTIESENMQLSGFWSFPGVSGNPLSPFFNNQPAVHLKPPYQFEEFDLNIQSTLHLIPKP